jgi:polysaccharide biosynthesis protein PslH
MAGSDNSSREGLRCLWLAREIPLPLNTGDRTYTAQLAKALAAAGASVTFMGFSNSAAASRSAAEAFESRIEWNIIPGRPNPSVVALASPLPLVAARFGTGKYVRCLKAMLRERDFDVVILDHYAMVWAVRHIVTGEHSGRPSQLLYIAHNFETELAADTARDFRGNPFRRAALRENARKIRNAERKLARTADIIVTLTAEDAERLTPLSPSSVKLVLPPGYSRPHVPDRQIMPATPRRVVIIGAYRWIPKQMNLSAFLEAADPVLQSAGVGLDIVGEAPDFLRKSWEARVDAARFHGFVNDLGQFLAGRRMGLVVEEIGGGFKLKALDYIFNRTPIAAIRNSMAGLPLIRGLHYLSYESMRELAEGVAAAVDDLHQLNFMQHAAYEECKNAFDWSDRGRTLCDALVQTVSRQGPVPQGARHYG